METIQLFNQEEPVNLRIVEHLDMQSLPQPLQQMLSLATTPEEEPWQSSLRFFSDDPCDEPLLYGPPSVSMRIFYMMIPQNRTKNLKKQIEHRLISKMLAAIRLFGNK